MILHWKDKNLALTMGAKVIGLMHNGERPRSVTFNQEDFAALRCSTYNPFEYLEHLENCLANSHPHSHKPEGISDLPEY